MNWNLSIYLSIHPSIYLSIYIFNSNVHLYRLPTQTNLWFHHLSAMLPVLSEEREQNVPRSVLGSGGMERRSSAMASGQLLSVSASNHQEFRKGQCPLLDVKTNVQEWKVVESWTLKWSMSLSLSQIGYMQLYLELGAMSFRPAVTAAPISQPKRLKRYSATPPCKTLFHGDGTQHPKYLKFLRASQSLSHALDQTCVKFQQAPSLKGPALKPPASHLHNSLNGVNQFLQQSDNGI